MNSQPRTAPGTPNPGADYNRLMDAAKARARELRGLAVRQSWDSAGLAAQDAWRAASRLAQSLTRPDRLRGQGHNPHQGA